MTGRLWSKVSEIERWLPVPGYEERYEVSDLGQVRSLDFIIYRKNGATANHIGRVLRTYAGDDGRAMVSLGRGRKPRVHKLVLLAFVGPPLIAEAEGCHNNGDVSNNRLTNLRWGSKSSNMLDIVKHGKNLNANKDRCPREHLLAPPNLVRHRALRGHRVCLACQRAHSAKWEARRRGRVFDFVAVADDHYRKIMTRVA